MEANNFLLTGLICANLVVTYFNYRNNRLYKRKQAEINRIDEQHNKCLDEILAFQIEMFNRIEKMDMDGAKACSQVISEQIKLANELIQAKKALISS